MHAVRVGHLGGGEAPSTASTQLLPACHQASFRLKGRGSLQAVPCPHALLKW